MSTVNLSAVALFVSAALTATAAFSQAPTPPSPVSHEVPALPKEPVPPQIPHPVRSDAADEDLELLQSDLATSPVIPRATTGAVTAAAVGTTLTPPVTVTYSGSSNAVTI